MARAYSLPFGTDAYRDLRYQCVSSGSWSRCICVSWSQIASFCRMKRMSVETSDAVRSTVPPGLAIPHVSAGLVILRVPDPLSVSFRTADLVLSRMSLG